MPKFTETLLRNMYRDWMVKKTLFWLTFKLKFSFIIRVGDLVFLFDLLYFDLCAFKNVEKYSKICWIWPLYNWNYLFFKKKNCIKSKMTGQERSHEKKCKWGFTKMNWFYKRMCHRFRQACHVQYWAQKNGTLAQKRSP